MKVPAHVIGVITLIVVVIVGVLVWHISTPTPTEPEPGPQLEIVELPPPINTELIGTSVQGRSIEVHTFGEGETDILFIGGIHGGYEGNTVFLANAALNYLAKNPDQIPPNITVHVVPNLNPDGFALLNSDATDAEKRFNANGVDLNRNFDCRWTADGVWRGNTASGGTAPFSEPEAVAIRDYIESITPAAAVVWHSKANKVYGSECGGEVSEETLALMEAYAVAAGYGQVPVFDAYVVTGAIEDWLASLDIPAVSVELRTHTDPEWEQNRAGMLSVLELYRK